MKDATVDWVNEFDVCTPAECASVRAALEELRPHWIQRHPVAPFYTMGASNYFDIAFNPVLPYYRMAARYNAMLLEHLGWFYTKLTEAIAEHLGEPAAYRQNLALPGFHIFLSDKSFAQPKELTHLEWFRAKGKEDVVGSAMHCDTAHHVVDWGGSEVDLANPISITISIVLPQAGAGLQYWDFGLEKTDGLPQAALREMLIQSPRHYHPYRVGGMAIHSGLRYHQMAPMPDMEPGDERITLQGHGVRCQGVWQLFW
jgi:hypothetical protein